MATVKRAKELSDSRTRRPEVGGAQGWERPPRPDGRDEREHQERSAEAFRDSDRRGSAIGGQK